MVSGAGVGLVVAPKSLNTETLAWTELETELGWASIATSSSAIHALVLTDQSDPEGVGLSQVLNRPALKTARAACQSKPAVDPISDCSIG